MKHSHLKLLLVSGKEKLSSATKTFLIKSFFSVRNEWRLLQVDTAPTPHDSPAVFSLETVIDLPEFKLEAQVAITDLSEQEDRNSGLELKQGTVAVTVFCQSRKR